MGPMVSLLQSEAESVSMALAKQELSEVPQSPNLGLWDSLEVRARYYQYLLAVLTPRISNAIQVAEQIGQEPKASALRCLDAAGTVLWVTQGSAAIAP